MQHENEGGSEYGPTVSRRRNVVHGYGRGDAHRENSGPGNTLEMHLPGVKELIRSSPGEPGHTSLSFPCEDGSWMPGPFLVSAAQGESK